ncbi:hypothetical protein JL827_23095 [Vibrio parahaemolyticus]|nr:hypothetical protein [Vibrio parahaemolyticus]
MNLKKIHSLSKLGRECVQFLEGHDHKDTAHCFFDILEQTSNLITSYGFRLEDNDCIKSIFCDSTAFFNQLNKSHKHHCDFLYAVFDLNQSPIKKLVRLYDAIAKQEHDHFSHDTKMSVLLQVSEIIKFETDEVAFYRGSESMFSKTFRENISNEHTIADISHIINAEVNSRNLRTRLIDHYAANFLSSLIQNDSFPFYSKREDKIELGNLGKFLESNNLSDSKELDKLIVTVLKASKFKCLW